MSTSQLNLSGGRVTILTIDSVVKMVDRCPATLASETLVPCSARDWAFFDLIARTDEKKSGMLRIWSDVGYYWVCFDETRFPRIALDTQICQFALGGKSDPFEPKGVTQNDFFFYAQRVLDLKDNIFDESWIKCLLANHNIEKAFTIFQQDTARLAYGLLGQ